MLADKFLRHTWLRGAMVSLLLLGVSLLGLALGHATAAAACGGGTPTVATDKPDYAPSETVHISGSGYGCAQTLTIKVTRPDGSVVKGDGFRMAYQALPRAYPVAEGITQVVIPADAIRTLGRLWEKAPRTAPLEQSLIRVVTARRQLELMVGDGKLEARFGPVALVAQLVEGTPPNWRQLIPQDPPQKVRAFGPDLERAVRQMREVAGKSGVVRLTWSEAALTVRAKGEETGEVETTVSVETQGEPGRVALKASNLLDYLRGKEGMVTMGVTTPTGPVLLRHGPSSEGLVLVMPMQVQW